MRLLELRKAKNISQQALADALSISQQSIDRYEKSINEPDIIMLKAIASYFNVSVDYLIGYSDNPHILSDMSINDLTKDEANIIFSVRDLPEEAQKSLADFLDKVK